MRAPYGLNIIDDCRVCPVRANHLFCGLPARSIQRLNEITSPAIYPHGALLFIEGQQSRGMLAWAVDVEEPRRDCVQACARLHVEQRARAREFCFAVEASGRGRRIFRQLAFDGAVAVIVGGRWEARQHGERRRLRCRPRPRMSYYAVGRWTWWR